MTEDDRAEVLVELAKMTRALGHIRREFDELRRNVQTISEKLHAEMVDRRDDDLEHSRALAKLQSKVLAKNAGAGAGAGALAVAAFELVRWLAGILGVIVLVSCSSSIARDAVTAGEVQCIKLAQTEAERAACQLAACAALHEIDRRSEDGKEKENEEKGDEEADEEKGAEEQGDQKEGEQAEGDSLEGRGPPSDIGRLPDPSSEAKRAQRSGPA